jgi:hypothetical protein
MALPLPSVVANVGPGGPLVTSMGGINALTNSNLENVIKGAQAKYAPVTTLADAASKLAYSSFMQPQYMAKLLGNSDIVANMTPDQRRAALGLVNNPASANPFALVQALMQGQQQPGLLQRAVNSVRNAFFGGQDQSPSTPQMGASNLSQQDQNAIRNMRPGDSYVIQGNQGTPGTGADSGMSYDQNGNNVVASPQEIANAGNKTPAYNSSYQEPLNNNADYFENVGQAKGTVKQREEQGTIRAKAIDELDQQYQQAIQAEVPLQHMNEIVTNPIFQNMRNYPWFQGAQLNMKSKIGSPEEQKLIGDFITTAQNAVAQTVMGFRGRILDKEVTMANNMKINPDDTFNVILGKLPSIEAFNEMSKQRSRIASELMDKKKMNRGEAMEAADKMVNGPAIRSNVEKMLDYPVHVRNKKTGQVVTMPASKARELGVPNV